MRFRNVKRIATTYRSTKSETGVSKYNKSPVAFTQAYVPIILHKLLEK